MYRKFIRDEWPVIWKPGLDREHPLEASRSYSRISQFFSICKVKGFIWTTEISSYQSNILKNCPGRSTGDHWRYPVLKWAPFIWSNSFPWQESHGKRGTTSSDLIVAPNDQTQQESHRFGWQNRGAQSPTRTTGACHYPSSSPSRTRQGTSPVCSLVQKKERKPIAHPQQEHHQVRWKKSPQVRWREWWYLLIHQELGGDPSVVLGLQDLLYKPTKASVSARPVVGALASGVQRNKSAMVTTIWILELITRMIIYFDPRGVWMYFKGVNPPSPHALPVYNRVC